MTDDGVNHPKHYNSHPSGVECIDIVRHMTFNLGSVFKYLWRAGLKDSEPTLKDLKKALFYLQDEIKRLEFAERDTEWALEEAQHEARMTKAAELLQEGPGLSNARKETNEMVARLINSNPVLKEKFGATAVPSESLGVITIVIDGSWGRSGYEIEVSSDETVQSVINRMRYKLSSLDGLDAFASTANMHLYRHYTDPLYNYIYLGAPMGGIVTAGDTLYLKAV